jgi:hypothetical protein
MNNTQLVIKVRQRLNKLASNDFDNIECWQIVEAFNKAQLEWCRRQLRGTNQYKDGDENSKRRIDDLQPILREQGLFAQGEFGNQGTIFNLPTDDYLEYKKITVFVEKECCEHTEPRQMQVYLAEAGDVNLLLRDSLRKPSYEWNETFATMQNNTIRVYHNGEFNIISPILFQYYRYPTNIQIEGCTNPITGGVDGFDVECEFKDDVAELIVDETVSILAGDVADVNNYMRGSQQAEKNN